MNVTYKDLVAAPGNHGGTRPHTYWIALHTTEGDEAGSAANWFHNPASGVCAHRVVGIGVCYRCLDLPLTAYHAGPTANANGIGIEITAHAAWSKTSWLRPTHRQLMKSVVEVVHDVLKAEKKAGHHIPLEFIKPPGLRAYKPGITEHRWLTAAFHESTHQDPGKGFPEKWFMKKLKRRMRRG